MIVSCLARPLPPLLHFPCYAVPCCALLCYYMLAFGDAVNGAAGGERHPAKGARAAGRGQEDGLGEQGKGVPLLQPRGEGTSTAAVLLIAVRLHAPRAGAERSVKKKGAKKKFCTLSRRFFF